MDGITFGDLVYAIFVCGSKSAGKGILNMLHLRKRCGDYEPACSDRKPACSDRKPACTNVKSFPIKITQC